MASRPASAASRPLSPHLSIWRWTATMAASITHRLTGIALYAGTMLLAIWAFAAAQGEAAYAPVARALASPFGGFILFGFAWALIFHTLNGLRHLYWDTGRGLNIKSATVSAWLVFSLSLAGAAAITLASLAERGSG